MSVNQKMLRTAVVKFNDVGKKNVLGERCSLLRIVCEL
jgi:hypothetical protein